MYTAASSSLLRPLFFVLRCLKLVITWVMPLLIGALVSCACLSLVFGVHSVFRLCNACTARAAERDYRARLLHTIPVLFPKGCPAWHQRLRLRRAKARARQKCDKAIFHVGVGYLFVLLLCYLLVVDFASARCVDD